MREAAFAAIADPTRRAILDLLLQQGTLTAGEIAAAFPQISRPAVSKHLKVLRAAGLVQERVIGREWHYRLDPEPLAELYRGWFQRYERLWQGKLDDLKRYVEEEL